MIDVDSAVLRRDGRKMASAAMLESALAMVYTYVQLLREKAPAKCMLGGKTIEGKITIISKD